MRLITLSTVAQFSANRQNSQESTGPSTPEGKAASALGRPPIRYPRRIPHHPRRKLRSRLLPHSSSTTPHERQPARTPVRPRRYPHRRLGAKWVRSVRRKRFLFLRVGPP